MGSVPCSWKCRTAGSAGLLIAVCGGLGASQSGQSTKLGKKEVGLSAVSGSRTSPVASSSECDLVFVSGSRHQSSGLSRAGHFLWFAAASLSANEDQINPWVMRMVLSIFEVNGRITTRGQFRLTGLYLFSYLQLCLLWILAVWIWTGFVTVIQSSLQS